MKIREDFVSNSSSCSFIIRNPVGCVQAFSTLLGMSISEIMSDLTRNYVSELNELETIVFKDDKTWDGEHMSFLDFLETFSEKKLYLENLVMFECDDYEAEKKNMLRYLYNAFKKCGYDVSADESEHDFLCNTQSKVTEKLSML